MSHITRKEAIAAGLKQYCNGTRCKNGNMSPRLVSTSRCLCSQCQIAQAEKTKQWRHANPNRARAHSKAQRIREPEKARDAKIAHYQENREKVRAKQADYRRLNPEKLIASRKRYYESNKAIFMTRSQERKASKRRAIPIWYGEFDRMVCREANRLKDLRKAVTGFDWHVDHMIPLRGKAASGLHVGSNLQVIPATMNLAKSDRMILTQPGEWISFVASGSISKPST